MPKGFFTQSAVALLARPISHDELVVCLKGFALARTIHAASNQWMGGPGVVLAMRPEVNGLVVVDVVDATWPDAMGDPKDDPSLFAAWTMGWFGPFTYPSNLARAQAMSFGWAEAAAITAHHRAFVRVKSSYVLGRERDAPVLPEDYDALEELEYVTRVTQAVMKLPAALACFNPNGETLHSSEGLDSDLAWHRERGITPLPAWTNVRMFRITPDWTLMDTIGMEQLDAPDHEACFPTNEYNPSEVANFLRNASEYVRCSGPVIKDGNTMDGPGGVRWFARSVAESIAPRPREVLRWLPSGATDIPEIAQ
jgi:Domain of unknown function (DUF4261)